jgi:hypothetical protein
VKDKVTLSAGIASDALLLLEAMLTLVNVGTVAPWPCSRRPAPCARLADALSCCGLLFVALPCKTIRLWDGSTALDPPAALPSPPLLLVLTFPLLRMLMGPLLPTQAATHMAYAAYSSAPPLPRWPAVPMCVVSSAVCSGTAVQQAPRVISGSQLQLSMSLQLVSGPKEWRRPSRALHQRDWTPMAGQYSGGCTDRRNQGEDQGEEPMPNAFLSIRFQHH